MSYTSITDIQNKLGTTLSDEQADYIEAIIPAIERVIETETGTQFTGEGATEVYASGDGTSTLILPTVNAITAVTHVGDDGDETAIAESDYVEYPRGGSEIYALRRVNGGSWEEGIDNYKISCTSGYSATPPDIKLVATEMAINALNDNASNYKSEKVGDWAVTYSETTRTLSSTSQQILNSYKRLSRSI